MSSFISLQDKLQLLLRNASIDHDNIVRPFRITRKVRSLLNAYRVYGFSSLIILGAYLRVLGEFRIGGFSFPSSRARRAFRIANIIVEGGLSYAPKLIVPVYGEEFCFDLFKILLDDAEYLQFLSIVTFRVWLNRFKAIGGRITSSDEKYITGELEELKWFFRRYIYEDIFAGPLAPYYEEPIEIRWVRRVLSKIGGGTLVDVGAFVGGYTLVGYKAGATVVALEPEPSNFEVLLRNVKENGCGNVEVLNIAAGASPGRVAIYGSKLSSTGASIKGGEKVVGYVDVRPLDEIIERVGLNRIDVLKIDVEGAEADVLRGAENTLRKTRYVLIEVWDQNRREVDNILKDCKFKLLAEIRHRGTIKYSNLILENTMLQQS